MHQVANREVLMAAACLRLSPLRELSVIKHPSSTLHSTAMGMKLLNEASWSSEQVQQPSTDAVHTAAVAIAKFCTGCIV
jgi:hypothetical protein